MLNVNLSNMLAADIASAVLNVLAIIGIVCLGAFIIVFLCDLILSISGNRNGIFFKKKETIYEQQPVQEREQSEDLSIYNERLTALEDRQNSIDMEKAEQEERELREKMAFDRERELESAEQKEQEQDERISDLEAKNAELLKLLEEKDEKVEEEHSNGTSLLEEIEDEEDDYDDIIAAINKMREDEESVVSDDTNEVLEDTNDDEETVIFDELDVGDEDVVQPTEEETTSANQVKDDEYYKTLSDEIVELKKELEEQKRIMEQDKLEAQEREEALRKENEQLVVELEDAKQTQETVEVTPVLLTEQEYLDRLEMLRERQKENDKQLRKVKKEYKPLERVYRTLERDKEKLRRREAIVAKQKIVLYGVNNYIDIDEEKAQKLAEDLDLLDGLRLSVQHCEEVIEQNKERYPILEQTYNILVTNSEQIAGDIKQLEDDLAKLKANETNGDEDAHQEMTEEVANEVVVENNEATAEAETANEEVVATEDVNVLNETEQNTEEVVVETQDEEGILENQISIDDVKEENNEEVVENGEIEVEFEDDKKDEDENN